MKTSEERCHERVTDSITLCSANQPEKPFKECNIKIKQQAAAQPSSQELFTQR